MYIDITLHRWKLVWRSSRIGVPSCHNSVWGTQRCSTEPLITFLLAINPKWLQTRSSSSPPSMSPSSSTKSSASLQHHIPAGNRPKMTAEAIIIIVVVIVLVKVFMVFIVALIIILSSSTKRHPCHHHHQTYHHRHWLITFPLAINAKWLQTAISRHTFSSTTRNIEMNLQFQL